MLPRLGSSKLVSTWIGITIVASIVGNLDGGFLAYWTALAPEKVFHGQVWRLVTWPFIERAPMSLVLRCITIFVFAGELAPLWGERRLRRFMLQIVVGAAVATCLGAIVSHWAWGMFRNGGWAVSEAMTIAWARQYPDREVQLYTLVRLNGRALIYMTFGIVALVALFTSPFVMMPELAACTAAALYPREWLRR